MQSRLNGFDDFHVGAVKRGMLANKQVIDAVTVLLVETGPDNGEVEGAQDIEGVKSTSLRRSIGPLTLDTTNATPTDRYEIIHTRCQD